MQILTPLNRENFAATPATCKFYFKVADSNTILVNHIRLRLVQERHYHLTVVYARSFSILINLGSLGETFGGADHCR